jgi:RimJ/RimL family protein N-acetyltransferase
MPFDSQPTLLGKLVEARPLRASDYSALSAVASDPLIWVQHPEPTRYQPAVFRAFFRESLESGGALLVHDASTRRVIGSSRFHGYDEALSEVEIGWTFLARSHWGGRYNGELKRLMLAHAFRFVDSVILFVSPTNIRSQLAVLRVGGVREPERDSPGRLFFRIRATSSSGVA